MTTKTYSVPGTTWYIYFYADKASKTGFMRHIVADDVHIRQPADPDCERCQTDPYVPHFGCLYYGKAMGHSEAHCTARGCY